MEQGARENYVSLIKKGSNEWLESEKVTELLLKSLGGVLGAHRSLFLLFFLYYCGGGLDIYWMYFTEYILSF